MATKTVFVDYVKHLQTILDEVAQGVFFVSGIRNLNTDPNKIGVVVTEIAGSVYEDSARIPYFLEIETTKPKDVINIFNAVAKEYNNKSFIEIIDDGSGKHHEYTIFENYSTPAPADKDVDFQNGRVVRLVLYVELAVLFEVGNVSNLEIDGEKIAFRSGTLAYATENFSNRESGSNLNHAVKKAATTTLQITMVNKATPFTNKIFQLMFGQIKNAEFDCKVTLITGFVGNLTMRVDNNAFNFARNSANLPSLNIVLTNAKKRN